MEDVSEVRTDGSSLLKAVYLSRLRLTRLLLEGGAYINESNERGETPLMVACKTRHTDQQSVPKAKLVKYLLESGADPNIQDKGGRTALMHACLERAGPEAVALLLGSGADPSLEDHRGSSALIHAVNTGDKETLRVLLDACKARGKEVIIITTDKLPSGHQMTKQYLNVPPSPHLADWPCASPSEIELHAAPQTPRRHLFTFGDCQGSGSGVATSQPGSPIHRPSPTHSGLAKLLHLQRLNSEPWLKIPPALLAQQTKASSLTEDLPDISPEEEISFRLNALNFPKAPIPRHRGADARDSPCRSQGIEQTEYADGTSAGGGGAGARSRSMTMSPYYVPLPLTRTSAASAEQRPPSWPAGTRIPTPTWRCPACATSSSAGRWAWSTTAPTRSCASTAPSHWMTARGCWRRESWYPPAPPPCWAPARPWKARGRGPGGTQPFWSAGAQGPPSPTPSPTPGPATCPRSTRTRPIPQIGVSPWAGAGGSTDVLKPLVPMAPSFLKDHKAKKMLLRRHSMQPEQIKQLVNMEEVFSH